MEHAPTRETRLMNPTPTALRILCYGDSNTWGRSGESAQRYPTTVRWTGQLQQRLGEGFEIIEEGLRSRTTDLNDDDPRHPGRNGVAYLRPCVESQNPLDGVILWLGTNDLKTKYQRTSTQVAAALAKLIEVIQTVGRNAADQPPWVLLISPPLVDEQVLKPHTQFVGAGEKSRQLAPAFKALAAKMGCEFLDLAPVVQPGKSDGVHLDPDAHQVVAEILEKRVRNL